MNERQIILDALIEILEHGAYTDRTLSGLFYDADKKSKALVFREVMGVAERMIYLDYLIGRVSKTPINKMKPVIRNILRMAAYEIWFMDGIKDYAAVNEAVGLCKKRGYAGLSGFVNGVLRAVIREGKEPGKEDIPARIKYSVPDEVWDLWCSEYGEDKAKDFARAALRQDGMTIRICGDEAGWDDVTRGIEGEPQKSAVQVRRITLENVFGRDVHACSVSGLSDIEKNEEFIKGRFYIQDISSIAAVAAADIKPGERIIDVCAAPGGKALYAAELAGGEGHVDARDLTEDKVRLIEDNIRRLGLKNITARVWDATVPDGEAAGSADLVIADLPCSGLGVIGKKPDIKYHFTQEKMHELSKMQEKILNTVSGYVKPGGRLLYSTCTMTKAENDGNADGFLARHPEFSELGRQQILPDEKIGNDGFFISIFKKIGDIG